MAEARYRVTHPGDNSRRWKQVRQARGLDRKIMELTGDNYGGSTGLPGDHLTLRVGDLGKESGVTSVYSVGEDSHTLWVGYPDEWCWHLSMPVARRVAWFVLWDHWAKHEWFGLRRRAYLWALRRYVRVGRWNGE